MAKGKFSPEKFKEEVDKLAHLLEEDETGCATWHMMVHDRMKAICMQYYGHVPS